MGRLRKVGKSIGSVASGIMLPLAFVPAKDTQTALSGNLGLLGIDAPIFQSLVAQYSAGGIGVLLVFWTAWAWLWPERIKLYNDAGEWSVSVDLGPGFQASETVEGGRRVARAFLQGCRFANLSETQARFIDVELKIPTTLSQMPIWTLSTSNTHQQPHREALKALDILPNGRFDRFLDQPIEIPPSGVVEGQIEFEVPNNALLQQYGFFNNLEIFKTEIVITERRSGLSKTFPIGSCYDAKKRMSYRGRVGKPEPVWRMRWNKAKEWCSYASG